MPKLLSSAQVIAVLEQKGFVFVSQKGSHIKYRKKSEAEALTVIVPSGRKQIPQGTMRSILRQSRLALADF